MGPIRRRGKSAGGGRRCRVPGPRDVGARRLHPHGGGERPRHRCRFLYPRTPYDTFKDFTPISLLASSANILLVRADSPFQDARRYDCTGASKAGGLLLRTCREWNIDASRRRTSQNLARIDIEAISYKGGAPAINNLLGGQIPMSFNNTPEASGQLRPVRCVRSRHDRIADARFCPMCRLSPRPCRATIRKSGGACSDPPACRPSWLRKSRMISSRP